MMYVPIDVRIIRHSLTLIYSDAPPSKPFLSGVSRSHPFPVSIATAMVSEYCRNGYVAEVINHNRMYDPMIGEAWLVQYSMQNVAEWACFMLFHHMTCGQCAFCYLSCIPIWRFPKMEVGPQVIHFNNF